MKPANILQGSLTLSLLSSQQYASLPLEHSGDRSRWLILVSVFSFSHTVFMLCLSIYLIYPFEVCGLCRVTTGHFTHFGRSICDPTSPTQSLESVTLYDFYVTICNQPNEQSCTQTSLVYRTAELDKWLETGHTMQTLLRLALWPNQCTVNQLCSLSPFRSILSYFHSLFVCPLTGLADQSNCLSSSASLLLFLHFCSSFSYLSY